MAYIVGKSAFNPFSFQELLVPLQMYSQEYKETENLLDKTSDLRFTDALTPGSQAATMYQTAETNLKSLSDELATQGLSSGLRSRLKSAARDYKQTMGQLTTAQAKLNEEVNRRLKLGEDYVYQDNDLTLDAFLVGKTVTPKQVSLSGTTKSIATEAGALAQSLMRDPVWNKVRETPGYYQVAQAYGLDNADIAYVTQRDTNGKYLWEIDKNLSKADKEKFKRFTDIAESKRKAIEYNKYDTTSQAKIDDAIDAGMYAVLGQTKYSFERDLGFETPSQRQAREQSDALFNWQYDVDENTGVIRGYNPDYLASILAQKGYKMNPDGSISKASSSGSSSGDSSERVGRIAEPIKITIKDDSTHRKHGRTEIMEKSDIKEATLTTFGDLTLEQKKQVNKVIGDDSPTNYTFYLDGKDVIINPKKTIVVNPQEEEVAENNNGEQL